MDTIPTQSPRFSLNYADVSKWLRNTWVFLAPVATIYLVFVAANLQGGFAWAAFIPSKEVIGAGALYLVNVALDLARKVTAGPAQ